MSGRYTDAVVIDSVQAENFNICTAFVCDRQHNLLMSNVPYTDTVYNALVHRITREPHEPGNHIRLLALLLRTRQTDALQGAILDLFLALGRKGHALRSRFLKLCQPLLTPALYRFLHARLERGLKRTECHPPVSCSFLSQAYTGSDQLLNRQARTSLQQSPLEEAREFLNNGQLDQARLTLEQALLQTPGSSEIATELADIYRHARDLQALRQIVSRLREHDSAVPASLQKLATEIEEMT